MSASMAWRAGFIASAWIYKLDTFTDENRAAQATMRELIWNFYRDLKAYRCAPTKQRKAALRARFDRIFKRKTGFVTLDRLLVRLNANKPELLMVLDRPEIPLHTNGSENDIRCHVTRRKVSAGTRSDIGRDCRDAFLGLAKTCAKLEIAFWDYLGDRPSAVPATQTVPRLPEIILARAPIALTATRFCPSYLKWPQFPNSTESPVVYCALIGAKGSTAFRAQVILVTQGNHAIASAALDTADRGPDGAADFCQRKGINLADVTS